MQRYWGKSALAWLTERRLERAQSLLSDPTRSIVDVARLSGFADAKYFARVFS